MFSRDQTELNRPAWVRYGAALGFVFGSCLVREALTPVVGQTALPLVFFFPAVTLGAWYGGIGPGILAMLLSTALADWFFIEPLGKFNFGKFDDPAALLAFLIASSFIVGAMGAMHRARSRSRLGMIEREKVEKALEQENALMATTLASIGDGVILTDAAGRVTFLNGEAERLTGWENSEASGRPLPEVFRILNEQSRQVVANPVEKVLRDGEVAGLANHTLLVSKDGRETPIDDSAAPIRQAGGPLFGVVLVFRDVGEQRAAQKASARLATIVRYSDDAILTKTLDGVIQTWNGGAERIFGYRAEEIIGKHVTTLFPPDRLAEEDHIIARLRQGLPAERLETIRVAKDGRGIPVSVHVSPIKDAEGNVIGASKVIHDISDVVAAREALVREKELLATTLVSIGDAVIMTDAAGEVTFLNGEAERLTGWRNSEANRRPLPEIFRVINEKTRQKAENPVEKVLRLGTVVGLANHTLLISKDGREIPIDDSAAPIRQPNRPLFGVVLVFRDFTERRRMEADLRQSHKQLANRAVQLEELVQERTARLQDMVDELQQVSYAMAHDMRAPLRAMNAFAELLSEEKTTAVQRQEYCRRISVAATRLDRLILDALHYTRVVQQEMPIAPVDLSKLMRDLIETYPNLHPDKADIVIEEDLPAVLGNDALLTQCFSNLLGNAVKFVAPGEKPQVRVHGEQHNGTAIIRVTDKGIGIPKNAQDRLFGMFQKLDAKYEGTGIGLAIVRKVVERMGGKVGVESEPGAGSSFWVELPLPNGGEEGRKVDQ